MAKTLLLVCDDAGFSSVDRGIRALADATGKPVCAEYLIEAPGAAMRAQTMAAHPLVSIGLHVELSGMSDADRVALSRDLAARGTTLGEQPDIQAKARADAVKQLTTLRETLGRGPAHVSTHGDFHLDAAGAVMPWWIDLMHECFGEELPPMQHGFPHVRHNKYGWNLDATKRAPLTPEQFEAELRGQRSDVVEFVMHPASPEPGDAPLDMLFTAGMRVADLEAAVAIIRSGCIERAGYEIRPMEDGRGR